MGLSQNPEPRPAHGHARPTPALVPPLDVLPYEGAAVLDEIRGSCEELLWRAARDAELWVNAAPTNRGKLFRAGSRPFAPEPVGALCPELAGAFDLFDSMTLRPTRVDALQVAEACARVHDWARSHGYRATAAWFADLAAYAAPRSAAMAKVAGYAARSRFGSLRARPWFERADLLERQTGVGSDARVSAIEEEITRAASIARADVPRTELEIPGRVWHEQFTIQVAFGPSGREMELARRAFEAYGPAHERLPDLAYQLAHFWLERGCFTQALAVFQRLLPLITDPAVRLGMMGAIAEAAGGAGDHAAFDRAWVEVWSGWSTRRTDAQTVLDRDPVPPRALLGAARGAASLRDWTRAGCAATAVRDTDAFPGHVRVKRSAAEVLDSVSRKLPLQTAHPGTKEKAESEALAADLLGALASRETSG